jgi:hypothetical protein
MHTKINKHSIAPNFLTHVFLVLSHPRKAASTPRTTTDLALLNYKRKHAYNRNKYFWSLQIVINSPEV